MDNKPIRPASTIILVKESTPDALDLFMVVRHHQIDVASGALVFPGGKLDKEDEQLANSLKQTRNLQTPDLLPFLIACIRESFEETGIFFARPKGSNTLLDASRLEALEHYREKLVKDEITLSQLLERENLELALDELHHFAHWITPEMAPKRFDTHFFIASAPNDQIALHDGEEAVDSVWISPQTLLEEANQGKWKVVFPTRMNIEKLGRFETFKAIRDYLENHTVTTVQPKFISNDEGKFLCLPEEADYPQCKVSIEKVMNP